MTQVKYTENDLGFKSIRLQYFALNYLANLAKYLEMSLIKKEIFDYNNVWVYTVNEDNGKSAKGRMCQPLEGQMNSAAVEWQMTFTCPAGGLDQISVNVKCINADDNLKLELCEVHGI